MRLTQRVLLLTLAAAGFAAAQNDPPGRVGRLNFISGTVSFQPGGVDDWVTANLNRPLTTGDHLWVDRDSKAEVHIGGSALRLGPGTAFEFLNLDDRATQIRLSEGTLVVRVRVLDQDQSFEVDTPNLAFTLLRPGEYRIDANPDNETTTITVRGGEGEVTGGGQAFPVHPNQQARVTGNDQVTYDMVSPQPPDYFEEWAMSRDRMEDRSLSARYVSREMIGYEDLDANGSWQQEPEYGAVWRPRAVPAGWAPYRYGHWAWIEPWGWTWVDDAPWGFAPFHYGRWAFVAGGWGWIPGPVAVRPVYAPALVAWVGGPRFNLSISVGGGGAGVAWFPLGPREVYVPSYRASPNYVTRVNTTNTTITKINVTNVYNNTNVTNVRYVNQTAPGAVTAVSRETFVNARAVGRATVPVNAAALQNAQVVRTAAYAPSRESVMGRSAGSGAARPPDAVMNRPVFAKTTPPPAPVPFAQRQQALAANPGQPLDAAAMSRIRAAQPVQARPLVRQVANAPAYNGRAPGSPALNPQAPAVSQPAYRSQPEVRGTPANAAHPQPSATPQIYTDRNRGTVPVTVPQNERVERVPANADRVQPPRRPDTYRATPAPVPPVQQPRPVQGGERRAVEPAKPAPAEHKEAAKEAKPEKKEKDKEEERRKP